ncbi:MAG: hypothetical protein ABRQ38_02390 [Candidatus Eremiobacterota bacterium]
MKPINVYFPPKSLRIAIGEDDAENLVNYIFHALDHLDTNQVLRLRLVDVDIITYSCLQNVIRRLTYEMAAGGKYHNKFMVIYDLPYDIYYRKDMLNTINSVIDNLGIPILLVGNAISEPELEYKVLGQIFYSNPTLVQVFNLVRKEEKEGNKFLTPDKIARKLNLPKNLVYRNLRRLHSFGLLIREYITSGKSKGEHCYLTVVSKALEE